MLGATQSGHALAPAAAVAAARRQADRRGPGGGDRAGRRRPRADPPPGAGRLGRRPGRRGTRRVPGEGLTFARLSAAEQCQQFAFLLRAQAGLAWPVEADGTFPPERVGQELLARPVSQPRGRRGSPGPCRESLPAGVHIHIAIESTPMYCSTFCSTNHCRGTATTGPTCPPTRRDSSTHSPNGTTGPTVSNVPAAPVSARSAARTPDPVRRRSGSPGPGCPAPATAACGRPRGTGDPGSTAVRVVPGPPIRPDRAIEQPIPDGVHRRPARRRPWPRRTAPGRPRRSSASRNGADSSAPGMSWAARRRCRTTRTSNVWPGRRAPPSASRTNPGCHETSKTASQSRSRRASYACGSRRSAWISRAPLATDPLSPRARHVTEAPRANACSANSRPSHCVPPSTSTSIGPIDHSGPVRGNGLRGGRNRGPTERARRPGGRRALRYRFCDQAVNFTLRRRAITNRATPTASSRAAPPAMPPMAAPVTGRPPPLPLPLSSQSAGAW